MKIEKKSNNFHRSVTLRTMALGCCCSCTTTCLNMVTWGIGGSTAFFFSFLKKLQDKQKKIGFSILVFLAFVLVGALVDYLAMGFTTVIFQKPFWEKMLWLLIFDLALVIGSILLLYWWVRKKTSVSDFFFKGLIPFITIILAVILALILYVKLSH